MSYHQPDRDAHRSRSGVDRRSIPAFAQEDWWTATDGHQIRRIDFAAPTAASRNAAPPRGSLLFLPGRGDHYEKYLESFAEWHDAGWRVTSIDWRGQAGSGRLGADKVTGHVRDFAQWIDDLAGFWETWRSVGPGPYVLIGHSMGGHLALRALAERRVDPDAAVLSAPMLGFSAPNLPLPLAHLAARVMAALGPATRPAWKWSEKPGEMPADRANLLTHDAARYEDELWWRQVRPGLVMGPGSWGWVERAYASMRALEQPGVLEQVTTPVLLFGTSADRLVNWAAIQRAARRLPNGELVAFGPEARHEILREIDPVRDRAMGAIAGFLDRVAPAQG
ncbi:MAG: lysophospholipase [Pelagerythrobacter marensis]|nr:MAG: lysophospholipase [Pelagerythrobacter marensis]